MNLNLAAEYWIPNKIYPRLTKCNAIGCEYYWCDMIRCVMFGTHFLFARWFHLFLISCLATTRFLGVWSRKEFCFLYRQNNHIHIVRATHFQWMFVDDRVNGANKTALITDWAKSLLNGSQHFPCAIDWKCVFWMSSLKGEI